MVLFSVVLSSCASVAGKSEKKYLLSTDLGLATAKFETQMPDSIIHGQEGDDGSFYVGYLPVTLSGHLQSSDIITYNQGQIQKHSNIRWAESLSSNITNVLSDFQQIINNDNSDIVIQRFPWKVAQKPEYIVQVKVTRFGLNEVSGLVELKAHLDIQNTETNKSVYHLANLSQRPKNKDWSSVIATYNQLLKELAIEVNGLLIQK